MIKQETININGRQLIKTYSDNNKFIIQNETGIKYSEAIDIPYKYTYKESEEDIPKEEDVKPIIDENQNILEN